MVVSGDIKREGEWNGLDGITEGAADGSGRVGLL